MKFVLNEALKESSWGSSKGFIPLGAGIRSAIHVAIWILDVEMTKNMWTVVRCRFKSTDINVSEQAKFIYFSKQES